VRLNLPGVELRFGRRLSDSPRLEIHIVSTVTDVKALARAVKREIEIERRRNGGAA
jgi:hypothetical protein